MKNKKLKITIVALLMITVLSAVSYGAFFISRSQTKDNKVLSGCFSTTFTENSSSINMSKALPMTDTDGLNTKPYTFTLSNTCSVNAEYYVILNVKDNSFSDEYISYNYSGNETKVLNTAAQNTLFEKPTGYSKSYILTNGTLKNGRSVSYNIKLWLNNNADYSSMTGKTWQGEIKVISVPSVNQEHPDVTLAYTKDGENTDETLAELKAAHYKMSSVTCSEGSASIVTDTEGYKAIRYTSLPAVCTVNFTKMPIACIDASGNEMACPATFTMGDRIAIGEGTNKQYFRYIRTTSTSSNLAECGTTSSVACNDSESGLHKFLAEYNLKRAGTASSNTAIASDALQDPSDSLNTNSVQFGASNSDYNQSYVKTYMANYQNVLNGLIGEANAVKVNLLSKAEVMSLFGCPSGGGTCSSIPTWAKNSWYWLGSAYNNTRVLYVDNNGNLSNRSYNDYANYGARAVVSISASLF